MEEPRIYKLKSLPRLFDFPYQLKTIGWMPHHLYIHHNNKIADFFIGISANWEGPTESEVNGERIRISRRQGKFSFSVTRPGTKLNSIQASYHDELYFTYSPEIGEKLMDFMGGHFPENDSFDFFALPEDIIAEIRHELLNVETPGAADRLDQLAVRLFTEIIISHNGVKQTGTADKAMKIHAIAEELQRGRDLKSLWKDYGLSERTFYREWQKEFAESPAEYRISRMIKRACDLLKNTTLKSGEIAEKCGFTSNNYFSQIFRKRKKMSPAEYRKTHSGKIFPI